MLNGRTITLKKGVQYKVLKPLATGGQGAIWEVRNQEDQQHYALKTVNLYEVGHSSLEENPPEKMQVLIYYAQAEIDFLSSLRHSAQYYIVPCLDHGFIEQGGYQLPSMLMPLYQQGDLALMIKKINTEKAVLTGQQWLAWFKQLMSALEYMQYSSAGEKAPVHRDIKPKNCLLDDNNQLFLIDFGIVRESSNTGTTSFVYTFNYCAPEQVLAQYSNAQGRSHFYITPAVDVYAAAIVMHEIVAGKIRAQGRLNEPTTKGQHDYALHQLTHAVKGKVGFLGEIGGLEIEEAAYLQRQLVDLFSKESLAAETVVMTGFAHLPNGLAGLPRGFVGLPDYESVSTSLVDILQGMLAPWPDDRPNATKVLQQLAIIEETLQPELHVFEVSSIPSIVNVGESLTLDLTLTGKGFPQHFSWLQVVVNKAFVQNPNFSAGKVGHIKLRLPAFEAVGEYVIEVFALVSDALHRTDITVCVAATAEQLWLTGKHEEALMLSLSESWLDEWQNKATTIREKYALLLVLERLQQHHGDNAQLSERIKQIDRGLGKKRVTKRKKKVPLLFLLLGGILLLGVAIIALMKGDV